MAKPEVRKTLAVNVRRLAQRRGLTMTRLADTAGVSRAQLYDVLGGKKGATLDWVARVAAALDAQPWELIRAR